MEKNKEMIHDKNCRIAIIGAGAAGLSAAETLKNKGYTNVIIFEKSARAGGQSLSFKFTAATGEEIIYDLGSIQPISTKVGYFGKLIKKYNLHTAKTGLPVKSRPYESKVFIVDYSKSPIGFPLTFPNIYYFLSDILILSKSLIKFRKLSKPGFTKFPREYLEELSTPYEVWIDQQQFRLIGMPLKYLVGIVLNWWHLENRKKIPVMKFLKAIIQFLKFPPRYINGYVRMMVEGYQTLWTRIAKNHDVRFKSQIKSISRRQSTVKIELENGETFTFDQLIITCLPEYLFDVMDVTLEEKKLFSNILCSPAWRVSFTAKNLPHDANYNFIEPYHDENFPNRMMLYFPLLKNDEDSWFFTGNLAYHKKEGIDQVLKDIEIYLKKEFDAEITWIKTAYWSDFSPFFPSDIVKQGIYYEIDALQGKNNTFYAGGYLSGASHAIVVEFSHELINTYFK